MKQDVIGVREKESDGSQAEPSISDKLKHIEYNYWLDGKTPMECRTLEELSYSHDLLFSDDRRLAEDYLDEGDVYISTVFNCIIPPLPDNKLPAFFETVIFSKKHRIIDQQKSEYFTWDAAMRGHQLNVNVIKMFLEQLKGAENGTY